MAIERESDVPTIDLEEADEEEVQAYSMPMVKNENGVLSYVKASITQMMDILKASVSGLIGLITTENLADECVTHEKIAHGTIKTENLDSEVLDGYMQKVTQEEFNEIFN